MYFIKSKSNLKWKNLGNQKNCLHLHLQSESANRVISELRKSKSLELASQKSRVEKIQIIFILMKHKWSQELRKSKHWPLICPWKKYTKIYIKVHQDWCIPLKILVEFIPQPVVVRKVCSLHGHWTDGDNLRRTGRRPFRFYIHDYWTWWQKRFLWCRNQWWWRW